MIGRYYKIHRDNVIDLFNRYKRNRGNINDGIEIGFLESRIDSLKKGKYTLAVVGEVKAGKSTFINALLGVELLPSDVLQATSAIVEIFKADKSFLRVRYVNGIVEEVYDDLTTPDIDEAKEKLQSICQVKDEFRDIPTTLIDKYIIYNDDSIKVNDSMIKELELASGIDLSNKKKLIENYIKEHPKETIPIEISFGYPLKWEFDELRIVDSPGVNALGGIQNEAFKYLEEANSILFVHPIKPIESESFKRFVSNIISNRSKETLFLVLTHAGLYTESDVEKLYSEALRLYREDIPKERIMVVDSILKLIYNDLENGKTLEEIEKISDQKADILPKFERIAKKKNKELKEILLEYSRFEKMYEIINEFSLRAPNLQLREIIETIKRGYEEQEDQYSDRLELLNRKKRNPQEFEVELDKIYSALSKYKNIIYKTKEEFESKYSGVHSEYNKNLDNIKNKYLKIIENSSSIEEVRKGGTDSLHEIEDLITFYSNSITQKLAEKFKQIGENFKEKYSITVPKVDLNAIESIAKKDAYLIEEVYETGEVKGGLLGGGIGVGLATVLGLLTGGLGLPAILGFGTAGAALGISKGKNIKVRVGEKKVYDPNLHLQKYKDYVFEEILNTINDIRSKFKVNLERYLEIFIKKINLVIDERQKALHNEKNKQQTNNEILTEIEQITLKKKEIPSELNRINEILEDLV